MRIVLDQVEDIAIGIKTFWFTPEKPVDYQAGQYIEMFLPHDSADERGQKHWFTLSSSPTEKLVAITTKHATGKVSTFKQTLFGLKPGTVVKISDPMGDFVLPKDPALPLVFVAAGMGVTPYRSIVKYLTDTGETRQVKMLYAVRHQDEVVFAELLEKYVSEFDVLLSQPNPGWAGKTGRLTPEQILDFAGSNPNQLIYVSGPEQLVETLETGLLAAGVPKDKLVLDFFPGYPAI